jgi:hypothetical protein
MLHLLFVKTLRRKTLFRPGRPGSGWIALMTANNFLFSPTSNSGYLRSLRRCSPHLGAIDPHQFVRTSAERIPSHQRVTRPSHEYASKPFSHAVAFPPTDPVLRLAQNESSPVGGLRANTKQISAFAAASRAQLIQVWPEKDRTPSIPSPAPPTARQKCLGAADFGRPAPFGGLATRFECHAPESMEAGSTWPSPNSTFSPPSA